MNESRFKKDPYEIIDAYRAWDLYEDLKKDQKLGSNKVGVLDTMFLDDHEAFAGSLKSDSNYKITSSHGTHVAGIIGAKTGPMRGIFQDAEIIGQSLASKALIHLTSYKITGDRVSESLAISNFAILRALYKILNDNEKICLNCSFGYNNFIQKLLYKNTPLIGRKVSFERNNRKSILLRFLKKGKDYLLVQSSGNSSYMSDFDGQKLESYYSCHFHSANPLIRDRIITVGALEDGYKVYKHGQLGKGVDILAPGVGIEAPVVREDEFNNNKKNSYARLTGTSMAAPFVSGTAAMIWYLFPDLGGPDIKDIIISSADSFYNPVDKAWYRKLNVYRALLYASRRNL